MLDIGYKISKSRLLLNLTQEQLADKLDVSRQTISKWESGIAYPETSKIFKLAQFLEVSCDYLLNNNLKIDKSPEIDGDKNGFYIDWSKAYPILNSYKNEVNIEKYKKLFINIFLDIQNNYNYTYEDSMLVAKDILSQAYFENLI